MKHKNEELLLKKLKEKWMWISQKEFQRETDMFAEQYYHRKLEPSSYQAKLWSKSQPNYWWFPMGKTSRNRKK